MPIQSLSRICIYRTNPRPEAIHALAAEQVTPLLQLGSHQSFHGSHPGFCTRARPEPRVRTGPSPLPVITEISVHNTDIIHLTIHAYLLQTQYPLDTQYRHTRCFHNSRAVETSFQVGEVNNLPTLFILATFRDHIGGKSHTGSLIADHLIPIALRPIGNIRLPLGGLP